MNTPFMKKHFLALAMLAGLANSPSSAVTTPTGATPAEMLANGDFSAGVTPWTLEQTGGATGQVDIVQGMPSGQAALRLKVLTLGDKPWGLQLCHKGIRIKKGETYVLSIWAKSDRPSPITVNCMQDHAPWEHHGAAEEILLSTEWKQTTFKFFGPYDDDNMRVSFTNLALATGQVLWFGNCSLQQIQPQMAGSPPTQH